MGFETRPGDEFINVNLFDVAVRVIDRDEVFG